MNQWLSDLGLAESRGRVDFDPRARLASFAILLVSICGLFSLKPLAVLALLGFLAAAFSGLSRRALLRRLLPVNVFMLLLWLTLPLTGGPPYWPLEHFPDLSRPGLRLAMSSTLKANAIVLFTSALISTTELSRLAVGLRALKVPVKLVWMLLLTYRYVVGLAGHISRSVMAIRLRAAGGRKLSSAAYAGLFARTFVRAHYQGERLALAMSARGFGERLALSRALVWRPCDSLLISAALLVTILAFLISRI